MESRARPVVAITGASAGIGAAAAAALARRQSSLVLSARRFDQLELVAAPLRTSGSRVETVCADVTRPEDMQAFVGRARDAFGRLDVLICNAGIGYHGPIDTTTADVMRRLMDVNYMGTFHAIAAALPVFRGQGSGHIVIVSSIVGRRGIGFSSAYSATKAAQVGLAEGLRAELYGSGIHVSLVVPISTRTEFHEAMRREFGHAYAGRGPRQEASAVGDAIARCVEHPRAEVYPHRLSRALVVLNAIAPGLTDRVVQKYRRGNDATGNDEAHDDHEGRSRKH